MAKMKVFPLPNLCPSASKFDCVIWECFSTLFFVVAVSELTVWVWIPVYIQYVCEGVV